MHALPHFYKALASGSPDSNLELTSQNLLPLEVAAPEEFDGPGNQWSPETMLMASVASCLILSFKAIAKASNFKWQTIECDSQGELNRVERKIQFTKISTRVRLVIQTGEDKDKAIKLLDKAEANCLITNSLSAESSLESEIVIAP